MNRRGFLGSILALGAAPAIVRVDSLMRMIPTQTGILSGMEWAHNVAIESTRNQLSTLDQITREALRIAHDRAKFIGSINREHGEDFLKPATIKFRSPRPYIDVDALGKQIRSDFARARAAKQ